MAKLKKLSRAKRRDEECTRLRATAEAAREIATLIEETKNPTFEFMQTIAKRVGDLEIDAGELESLKEEIEEWRDNMPESLQNGDKYSTLDETANTLDTVVSELESIDIPEFKLPPDQKDKAKVEEAETALGDLPEALNEFADNVDGQCDEADNAEFPGMMG